MLSYTPDNTLVFSVDFDRFDCHDLAGNGRWSYHYQITVNSQTLADGCDLRGATTTRDQPESLAVMLATLITCFGAYIEALDHQTRTGQPSENHDLFPPACVPLAEALDAGQVTGWADEIRRCL